MSRFADVILPLPLAKYFTYRIPEEWQETLVSGSRVIVPFGRKRFYTAIVARLHNNEPQDYEIKDISTLLDNTPVLRRPQLRFWEWLANYYLCSVGDVFKAAVPSGLKIESETQISCNADFIEENGSLLKEREAILLDTLSRSEKMSVQELEKESGLRNILPLVRSLMEQKAIVVSEELRHKYRPRTESYIRLAQIAPGEQEKLRPLFDELKAAKKQLRLLMCYLELSGFMQKGTPREVSRKELLERAEVSPQILSTLVTKGIFENEVYDGIPEMLKTLQSKGYFLAVASSKPQVYVERILEHFDLASYFEFVGGADLEETRVGKGDVIQYVLDTCGLSDKKEKILMIGDREHDVLGARKQGLECVGVLFGYGDRKEMEDCDAAYIAESINELRKMLLS